MTPCSHLFFVLQSCPLAAIILYALIQFQLYASPVFTHSMRWLFGLYWMCQRKSIRSMPVIRAPYHLISGFFSTLCAPLIPINGHISCLLHFVFVPVISVAWSVMIMVNMVLSFSPFRSLFSSSLLLCFPPLLLSSCLHLCIIFNSDMECCMHCRCTKLCILHKAHCIWFDVMHIEV